MKRVCLLHGLMHGIFDYPDGLRRTQLIFRYRASPRNFIYPY